MKFAMINKSLMVAGITIFSLISFPVQAEEPTEDPAVKCFDYLYSMPELKHLENKITKNVSEATFEQLANQDKATDQEKLLIAKLAKGVKICSDMHLDFTVSRNVHATGIKILEENANSRMSSLIDLYNQKISYGEYMKQRQAAIAKFNRDMAAADAEIDAENAAQKGRMWGGVLDGMARGFRNSLPPRSVICTPDASGSVRCQ